MGLEDSKLTQLLKTFTPLELKRLENFILSPFFNTSKQINTLFNILKKSYPEFDDIAKEKIFKAIYPNETYKDKKVRDLLSRLLKLTEAYLAHLEFSGMDMLQIRFAMQQLSRRNLEKHFTGKLKEAEQQLDKEKIVSADYFFNKYSILKEKRSYLEILTSLGKRTLFFNDIIEETDLFVVYSIYKILKYGLTFQTHERISRHKYDFKMLDEILLYLKANPINDYPVIMIQYYTIILNRDEGDESMYFELRNLLKNNLDTLEEDDRRTIMVVLFNYTKTQALKGNQMFRKENYIILKDTIEKGLHPMEGNFFPESSYITVVGTALQEKDYQWAENFMKSYKEQLPPEQRENAYNLCNSILNYRLGKYGVALKGLARVSIDDFYYHLRVKNHQLKIYYEMGDYDSTERTIDSFRHFLSTTKFIPEYIKVRFVNYVNFVSRIVNARLSGHLHNLIDIKNEIVNFNQEHLENKTWLLEQINKVKI